MQSRSQSLVGERPHERNGHAQIDRLPPHDENAEKAVLGCVLLDWQGSMPICIGKLGQKGEAFYDLRHQQIYEIMVQMYDAQEPIDMVMLSSWLTFQSKLEAVGGVAYLASLSESTPSASNLEWYIGILEEKFKYRKLIRFSTNVVSSIYDGNGTADELINDAAENVFGLVTEATTADEEACLHDLIPRAIDQIESWHASQGTMSGISTGLVDLDKLTTGLHAGELIVIAGRPSLGKTSLAMNIAEHVAVDQGLPVGVFSLEMTKDSLTLRMLCSRARVNPRSIRNGFMAERDLPKLTGAAGKLHNAQIFINDSSGLSIVALRAKARRMHQQHGIKLLVVDYMQLMHAERQKNDTRDREIGMISGGLKCLAKELEVPVIAISQLNRTLERDKERRPRLSDLRESGNIEQDADMVAILWRPKGDDDDDGEMAYAVNLEILKQRNGPTGTVPLTFLRCYTRFESAAKVQTEDSHPYYQQPYADNEPPAESAQTELPVGD